ncbi:MAG TPA: OmpH family outer membrane protein [Planctomycetota bacterium]|nr:OmpH family outer membrane protein [Planctomycetota bacterium]
MSRIALTALALVALTAGTLAAGDAAPAADASKPKTLRIGVVRLQEVVERYKRYVYITARFTEDFKDLYTLQNVELEKIKTELEKQQNAGTNADDVILDEEAFKKFTDSLQALEKRRFEAMVTMRGLDQLKEDLNSTMSLVVMDDITDAVKAIAHNNNFDCVTDYFPVESAKKSMTDTARKQLELSSMLLLDNLQNRAPTLYADPSLDITDAVVSQLNLRYDIDFAKAQKPDPMLSQPLSEVVKQLKQLQANFQAARKGKDATSPAIVPPIATGYPYGVVNLQTVIENVTQARKYSIHLDEYKQNLRNAEFEYSRAKEIFDNRSKEIQRDNLYTDDNLNELAKAEANLMKLQRDYVTTRMTAAAIAVYTSRRVFEEISQQTIQQAKKRGIQLVIATFGSDQDSTTAAVTPGGMVAWYKKGGDLDLTQSVVASVTAEFNQKLAAGAWTAKDVFHLGMSETQLLSTFAEEIKKASAEQKTEDERRFADWHKYQKDVLHVTPHGETVGKPAVPAPAPAPGPGGPGGAAPAPTPVPVPAPKEGAAAPGSTTTPAAAPVTKLAN